MTTVRPLNKAQQDLVETHLHIVSQVIHADIIVNETIYGFEYDDLYQEGCIWLCKAAICYDSEKKTQFGTFAWKVVSNGLKTYCRLMCSKQKRVQTLPSISDPEDPIRAMDQFPAPDSWDDILAQLDAMLLLDKLKQQYHGTVRLGIEAIEWKVMGYTGAQIAAKYGVKPNLVGAWISRAAKKIEQNGMFLLWRTPITEKTAS